MSAKCGDCGEALAKGAKRCPCGWSVPLPPHSGRVESSSTQVDRNRCAWEVGGERCHYAGTSAHGSGSEISFYCSGHFSCNDPVAGAQIHAKSREDVPFPDYSIRARKAAAFERGHRETLADAKHIPAVNRQLAAVVQRTAVAAGNKPQDFATIVAGSNAPKHDRREWARVIVARAAAGQRVTPYAIELAREALSESKASLDIETIREADAERRAIASGV